MGLIVNDKYKDEVELRYYTDIAYKKAVSLEKLIDELFEYTKISHGGIQIRKTQISLGELIGQLAEEFVPILNENAINCELLIPSNRIYAYVDGDMLVRVLENLISNAIRYGKDGKQISLELLRQDSEAVIRVINYGEPIPLKDLPHLFENFYRIEKSRSEQMGGTGLGLAIAKKFVELHGGTIAAYSQNGKTIFEIRLPENKQPSTLS